MKTKIYFTSLLLSFTIILGHAQVIYVNLDATGSNDGTSWENAYTDLSEALNNAASGQEVWVAAGVYKPGGDAPNNDSFFNLPDGVSVYGGFNGTEANLQERDYESNITALSGDLADDDVTGDFVNFRSDNVKHVVFVQDVVGPSTRLDGFTIRNGQTVDVSGSGDDRRGGAILCYGAPVIANCTFTQNYGYYAGAVYPRGSASSGTVIDNCTFFDNLGGYGGGMYIISNTDISVMNTVFEANVSQNRGGAVYNGGGSTSFMNCEFIDNTAASSGAVYHNTIDDPDNVSVVFTDCYFSGNRGNFGGAMALYGNGTSLVENCEFDNNTADAGGGALSIGFTNNSMLRNTVFVNNQADRGGAIWQQNDTTMVTIEDCTFETNLCATNNGGAIYQRGSASLRIFDTEFFGNRANFGGAIYMTEDSVDLSNLVIERCMFNFNVAEEQGGAINISNSDCFISNSVISNSILSTGMVGGGISTNASGGDEAEVTLLNSTLFGNLGLVGAGIAQWTDSDTSSMSLMSQNNIYFNVGNNYEVEAGNPEFISMGGNLSSDLSLSSLATESNDFHNTNPILLDPDSDDFRLGMGSPCIDNGTADNAPDVDIVGNARVGDPDIGAYEFQPDVGTEDIVGEISVTSFPSPSTDWVNLEWSSDHSGRVQVDVFSVDGRLQHTQRLDKTTSTGQVRLAVEGWVAGEYKVVIYERGLRYIGSFTKI